MTNQYQLKIKEKWKRQPANVKISKELRDIIHGYIMSDGYVTPTGILQIDQSKKQERFVQWLYDQLKPLRTNTPYRENIHIDKRTNTKTYSTSFSTKTLLQGFRAMWYQTYTNEKGQIKYRKCLPKSLPCFFNAIFITLWFAGDGTKLINQRGAKFEVTAFTVEERLELKKLFKEKFDINAVINRAGQSKSGKRQWTLSINSNEYDRFRELITQIDLIPTLFPYKLHSVHNP